MTRRGLLLAAGAGAAGLGFAGGARAAIQAPGPALFERRLGSVGPGTVSLGALPRFALVGAQWSAPARSALHVRVRRSDRSWSPWAQAGSHGHEPAAGERPAGGDHVGEPVWVGGADALQLWVAERVHDLRLHFVDAGARGAGALAAGHTTSRLDAAGAALRRAEPVLHTGPGQPPIIARHAWARGTPPPRTAPGYGAVRVAFVHHTENPNGYASAEVPALLRAIYAFHRDVRGWHDIGYNFVVDGFGRIWEARAGGIDEPVVGAHAGGYNVHSTGVAVLGTFSGRPLSQPARRALTRLLAWKLSLHGLPVRGWVTVQVGQSGAGFSRFPAGSRVRLPRVAGHRDGDLTSCPGDALYGQLAELRRAARALAGRPLALSLAAVPTSVPAPGPLALAGHLAFLDGTPAAGVVEVQGRRAPGASGARELTLAVVQAAADGSWSVNLPVLHSVSLRALHRQAAGLPASVSEPLDAEVACGLTLRASPAQVSPGGQVTLSGTVVPPKPGVSIAATVLAGDGTTRRLSPLVADGSGGSFTVALTLTDAERYRFQARTPADGLNAAGASAPVEVTVAPSVPPPSQPGAPAMGSAGGG